MPESTDGGIRGAFEAYALAVHEKRFPGPEHSFK